MIALFLFLSNSLYAGIISNPFGAFTEVSATGATTQTSGAGTTVMNTMTITPAPGDYLVLFSTWCSHSTASATITFSIFNNAVQKTDSVRTIIPFPPGGGGIGGTAAATINLVATIEGVVTVTTGAVDIRWATSSNTATCTQRTLDLVRLK
jgi:hypothetical protein